MLAALAMAALVAAPAAAGPNRDKLDLALRQKMESGTPSTTRVIITVKHGLRPLLRDALRKHGDALIAEHPAIEAITAEVHGEDLEALAADPAVAAVSSDAEVRAQGRVKTAAAGPSTVPYAALRPQLGIVGDFENLTGAGVGIAIIDSGISPVGDFGSRITAFYDFTLNGTPQWVMRPYDNYGHGTFVAGLAAGSGANSHELYMGVAPKARLIGLRVLDETGSGLTSHVISAVNFAVANKHTLGIDIINLSLGHPILAPAADDPLVQAVEHAVRNGIVVVTSAGNFGTNPATGELGYAGITSPGNAPSAITVGSLKTKNTVPRADDTVASYSSRGPSWYDAFLKPDLVAPGDQLISDIPKISTLKSSLPKMRVRSSRGDYLKLSGTSMAAGVTSGAIALVLEAARCANDGATPTPNLVKALVQFTAIPVENPTTDLDHLAEGAGGLNAAGAVVAARSIDLGVPAGQWWATVVPEPFSTIGSDSYAWSQNIVWGANIVWGTNIVWSNNIVWGANIVWGSALDGDNIVWGTDADGDNIVWGTAADTWGDNIVWGTGLLTTVDGQNIVWSTYSDGDNIVWGTLDSDNIVWGTFDGDNIVWGTLDEGDNIVWGTRSRGDDGDNIVWGTRSAPRKRK